ncbi:MAG: hypothetical protein U5L09_16840 [Bacteroidales bacterium]|nr:hypothetical protein [Bacteroidales bacterium]
MLESILTDFFNVEGVRNKHVEKLLEEVHYLINSKQHNSPEFDDKYQELKEIIGATDRDIIDIDIEIATS